MIVARILSRPPVSGSIPEKRYDATGDCTWVHFTDPEGEDWAGVFGNGEFGRSAVAATDDAKLALVIAAGQGYVVRLPSGDLLYRTDEFTLQGAVSIPGRPLIGTWDWNSLAVYSEVGREYLSSRVADDGIERVSASPTSLSGFVWQHDGWHEFKLTLDTWLITVEQTGLERLP